MPPAAAASDDRLMAEIKAGSTTAFRELYDRYAARAFRLARTVCPDEGLVEDAVQEAFLSIWRGRAGYEARRGAVPAWLLTAVRHRAIDVARRNAPHARRRSCEDALDRVPGAVDVPGRFAERAQADGLREILTRLPDPQREVVVLAYFGELTHHEIAGELRIPLGTVKGRMRLAMGHLRAEFERGSVAGT